MKSTDWWPPSFEKQLEMAKKWKTVLAVSGAAWGISAGELVELDVRIAGCTAADTLVLNDGTAVNRAVRRQAYKDLAAFCRNIKRLYLNEPPRSPEQLISMGIKPKDQERTKKPAPQGFVELSVTYPGPHTVMVHAALAAGSPPDPEGANYGVRLYWGVMPPGGASVEMATGPRRELMRIPQNGDELPHSVFFRGRKKKLDFLQEDSGKTLYLCARFENPTGEWGGWGTILSIVIP